MEALQLNAPLVTPLVTEVTDRTAFMALESEWNALVEATADEPFYRHEFLRIWKDDFAPEARSRVLTLRDDAGRLTAALPLMAERAPFYGVPARQLSATANAHSCRFDMLARQPQEAAEAFLSHLRGDKSWDVLRLTDIPEGGAGWALYEAAKARGLPVGTWESLQSPYIPLSGTWEEFQAKLPSKFKANCRRRRRKLEEKGQVTFERVEGGLGPGRQARGRLPLEASGWKGQRGTAMAQDKQHPWLLLGAGAHGGYSGRLALYFLRLDGRAVAFHFGLESAGRYFLLKPGYDESLKECSPGQLLMEDVLPIACMRGPTEFDFLGPDMGWKRDWTDRVAAIPGSTSSGIRGSARRCAGEVRLGPEAKRRRKMEATSRPAEVPFTRTTSGGFLVALRAAPADAVALHVARAPASRGASAVQRGQRALLLLRRNAIWLTVKMIGWTRGDSHARVSSRREVEALLDAGASSATTAWEPLGCGRGRREEEAHAQDPRSTSSLRRLPGAHRGPAQARGRAGPALIEDCALSCSPRTGRSRSGPRAIFPSSASTRRCRFRTAVRSSSTARGTTACPSRPSSERLHISHLAARFCRTWSSGAAPQVAGRAARFAGSATPP